MAKTGLVLEGGGMRGLFTAGILDVLMENNVTFDGVVGVSAGATFGCNFISHQIGRTLRYNMSQRKNPKYMGIRSLIKTGDYVGGEYAYHVLPTKLDVFDFEAGNHLPTEFLSVEQSPHYLYEPNASIMKAGAFDLVANRFGITQVGKNSHLFVSDTPLSSFPGRCFVIDNIVSMNKREVKQALKDVSRANISVRNFPMSVAELRRRLKLKDGGDVYLFATTVERRGHQLFVCRKTE